MTESRTMFFFKNLLFKSKTKVQYLRNILIISTYISYNT